MPRKNRQNYVMSEIRSIELRIYELEHLLKMNPGLFRSIYTPRYINNVYLDSPTQRFFTKTSPASRPDTKFAFAGMVQPPIELANRSSSSRSKEVFLDGKKPTHWNPSTLEGPSKERLMHVFIRSNLPSSIRDQLHELEPTLLNRYRRSYFLSSNQQVRATLDCEISYARLSPVFNHFLRHVSDAGRCVLELKYPVSIPSRSHHHQRVSFPIEQKLEVCSRFIAYTIALMRNPIDGHPEFHLLQPVHR